MFNILNLNNAVDNSIMLYYRCCGRKKESHKIWGYLMAVRKSGGDRATCQSSWRLSVRLLFNRDEVFWQVRITLP